jgi:hypothetical protein
MDAAKMEALEGLVSEVDGESPEAQQADQAQAQQAEAIDAGAREWAMIAFVIGNGLAMIAPELRKVYTEEACMSWGASMMPVADKYGWNSPSSLPELGLLIATMGLAVPSVLAVRQRIQQAKEATAAELAAKKARDLAGAPDGG